MKQVVINDNKYHSIIRDLQGTERKWKLSGVPQEEMGELYAHACLELCSLIDDALNQQEVHNESDEAKSEVINHVEPRTNK